MRIFVTNLATSVNRRKHMEKEFRKTGLEYEFVNCVIGADLSDDELSQKCDMKAINEHNRSLLWFNKGIIGCTLTNQNTYKKIVNENIDYALLLEDDTILPENLESILLHVESFIKQGDVILLFSLFKELTNLNKTEISSPFGFDYYHADCLKYILGGSGFIVTRDAAEKMLNVNTPIHITPDAWGYFCETKCIERLLIAFPEVVGTADFKSTMELGQFKTISTFIDRYKIFPFFQLLKFRRNKRKQKLRNVNIIR